MLAVCSGIVMALKGNKDSWTLLSTSESIVYSKQYLFSTLDNWRNLFSVLTSRWQADYLELITTFQKFSDRHKFRPKREFCPTSFTPTAGKLRPRDLGSEKPERSRRADGFAETAPPQWSPSWPPLASSSLSVCLHLWARENEVTCRADTVRTAFNICNTSTASLPACLIPLF